MSEGWLSAPPLLLPQLQTLTGALSPTIMLSLCQVEHAKGFCAAAQEQQPRAAKVQLGCVQASPAPGCARPCTRPVSDSRHADASACQLQPAGPSPSRASTASHVSSRCSLLPMPAASSGHIVVSSRCTVQLPGGLYPFPRQPSPALTKVLGLPPPCRFELSAEDMAALDGLEEGLVTGWNPIRDHAV